jgi:hypothetical protein
MRSPQREAGRPVPSSILKGNPAANINDVENVILVFKDGVVTPAGS